MAQDDIEALEKGDTRTIGNRRIERTLNDGSYYVYELTDDGPIEIGRYKTYSQAEARANRS